jgi:hypothetical protein
MAKPGCANDMPIARSSSAHKCDQRMGHALSKLSSNGQPGVEMSPRAADSEHNMRRARHVLEGEVGEGGGCE